MGGCGQGLTKGENSMNTFDFRSMHALKLQAKACKDTHSALSLAQRLDLIARRDFGFASFNQAKKLRQADIDRHIESKEGVTTCPICDLTFDIQHDRREHYKRHEQFEEAAAQLGFVPMNRRRREDVKAAAWRRTHEVNTIEEKAKAYLSIFNSWFHRSMAAAINSGYWRKHPDFPAYVSMLLPGYEMPTEVSAHLTGLYGVRPGHIKPGQSYWYPK